MSNKEDTNKVVKASIWYTLSNILIKGIGFITIPIFTRILSQSDFGSYNNFASWFSILGVISSMCLSSSLIRARFDYKDKLNDFVFSILVLGTLSTSIIYLIFCVKMEFFSTLLSLDKIYIHIMFICLLVNPAFSIFQLVQRFKYNYKLSVLLSIGSTVISVVLSLILVNSLSDRLFGRVFGMQLPLFVISLAVYIYYFKKARKVNVSYWKYALTISIPFVIHMLSNTLLSCVDRIMITKFDSEQTTALYSLAYNIALIILVIFEAMNSAFAPWLGEKLNSKQYKDIYKVSQKYIAVFAFLIIGVMLVAPEALLILGGSTYISAKYVIPPVMLGCFFVFLYTLYVNIEQFEKKTFGMALGTLIVVIINVILNMIFIPIYGYIAAAYTTLFGYILLFIFHFILVKKIGLTKIYNTKFIMLIIIVESLVCLGVNFIYDNIIIRYIFLSVYILVFVVVAISQRKFIMSLLKRK